MNIKAVIIAAYASPSRRRLPHKASAESRITPNFKHAIPNIPGKSLVARRRLCAGGRLALGTRMPSRPSSTPTSSRAPSSSGERRTQAHLPRRRELVRNARRPSCCALSRNASAAEPAKLLAVFVVDTDDKILTTPDDRTEIRSKTSEQASRLHANRAGGRQGPWRRLWLRHAEWPTRYARRLGLPASSQINNCAYCLDMHTRDLLKKGRNVEKLALVQAWAEAGDSI